MIKINPRVTIEGISMLTTAAGRACSQSGQTFIPIAVPPWGSDTINALPLTQRADFPSGAVTSLKFDDVA